MFLSFDWVGIGLERLPWVSAAEDAAQPGLRRGRARLAARLGRPRGLVGRPLGAGLLPGRASWSSAALMAWRVRVWVGGWIWPRLAGPGRGDAAARRHRGDRRRRPHHADPPERRHPPARRRREAGGGGRLRRRRQGGGGAPGGRGGRLERAAAAPEPGLDAGSRVLSPALQQLSRPGDPRVRAARGGRPPVRRGLDGPALRRPRPGRGRHLPGAQPGVRLARGGAVLRQRPDRERPAARGVPARGGGRRRRGGRRRVFSRALSGDSARASACWPRISPWSSLSGWAARDLFLPSLRRPLLAAASGVRAMVVVTTLGGRLPFVAGSLLAAAAYGAVAVPVAATWWRHGRG